jgi:dihydroorotase
MQMEPKGTIESESRAAVAGGITSFCEMPNTIPPTIEPKAWEAKMRIAKQKSYANYAFYLGASPGQEHVLDEMDPTTYPGVKIYMTAHTADLLMSESHYLHRWFQKKPPLIVVHAEDHQEIVDHLQVAQRWFEVTKRDFAPDFHIDVRGRLACLKATQRICELAQAYEGRLHIAHVTTKEETVYLSTLFRTYPNLSAEVCSPHLFFSRKDYRKYGNWIKVNPSVKEEEDREALWRWLYEEERVLVSTDHAPHTLNEKSASYLDAPSGIPSIQWIFPLLLTRVEEDGKPLWWVSEWLAHRPARLFRIEKRGKIAPGYYADLVLMEPLKAPVRIGDLPTYWLPKWNPFADFSVRYLVKCTWVSGYLVYSSGKFIRRGYASPFENFALRFER